MERPYIEPKMHLGRHGRTVNLMAQYVFRLKIDEIFFVDICRQKKSRVEISVLTEEPILSAIGALLWFVFSTRTRHPPTAAAAER